MRLRHFFTASYDCVRQCQCDVIDMLSLKRENDSTDAPVTPVLVSAFTISKQRLFHVDK